MKNAIPDEWILRDITERDYGIDCYMELVKPDLFLTGDNVLLQLKGKSEISWRTGDIPYVDVTGIKKSTAEYWMKLQIPVFVVLTDRKEEKVYAVPIKRYIRRNYASFLRNSTFSVRVRNNDLFNVDRFYMEYRKERDYNSFKRHLVSFLVNIKSHADFVVANKGRHENFEVDPARHLYLISFIDSA